MYIPLKSKIQNVLIKWLMRERTVNAPMLSDFERIRFEIRPCDVLLIEGRTKVSDLVRASTQSPWSHAALYIGRLHDIEDQELRHQVHLHCPNAESEQLVIESVLGEGAIVTPISFYQKEHIRICRPVGLAGRDAQKVIEYAIRRLGAEYDTRQIIDLFRLTLPWHIFPRHWRSTLFTSKAGHSERMICSTLIAEAFHSVNFPILPVIRPHTETGVEFIPRNPRLYTPSDFDYSPFFEIIKYPIIDVAAPGIYKHFPWAKDGRWAQERGGVDLSPNDE